MRASQQTMQSKASRFFICSAGCLLLITAVAKLISSGGSGRVFQTADPILGIPFRYLFWTVGGIELLVAFICLSRRLVVLQAGVLAWLATVLVIYRLGILWVGYKGPCICLGTLTAALNISDATADTILKAVLAYLLFGSYALLFWQWRQERKTRAGGMPTPNSPVEVGQ